MRRMTDLTFERFSVDHKYDPLQHSTDSERKITDLYEKNF